MMILRIKIHAPDPRHFIWNIIVFVLLWRRHFIHKLYQCESTSIKQNYFYEVHEHIVFQWHTPFPKCTYLYKSLDIIPCNIFSSGIFSILIKFLSVQLKLRRIMTWKYINLHIINQLSKVKSNGSILVFSLNLFVDGYRMYFSKMFYPNDDIEYRQRHVQTHYAKDYYYEEDTLYR